MEIVSEINDKVEVNAKNISCILEENMVLKKENDNLKGRLSRIEQMQLSNNISGMPEQKWESYEATKNKESMILSHQQCQMLIKTMQTLH